MKGPHVNFVKVLVCLIFLSLFTSFGYSCVELKGITGPQWKIINKNQEINLGPVGKGSYLNFIIDVQERQHCPPWDNWDKAWIEGLPSKGFKQLNTSWFQIYFAPFTLLVLKNAKNGNYTVKFCVEDQGTKIIECHKLRFRVENPRIGFKINITKGFNAFTIAIKETGNMWIYCWALIKGKNTTIKKRFYSIPGRVLYIPFAPKYNGNYSVYVYCPEYKYNKSASFNFKRVLFEITKTNITLEPGDSSNIQILSYPYVRFSFSSAIPLYNTVINYNEFSFKLPKSVFPGTYNITICGSYNGKKECKNITLNVFINWSLICPFIHVEAINQTIVEHNLTPIQIYFKISNDDNVNHQLPIKIFYDNKSFLLNYPNKIIVPKNGYYLLKILLVPQNYTNSSIRLEIPVCRKTVGINIYIYKEEKKIYPEALITQPTVTVNPSFFEVYPTTKYVTVNLYIDNNNNIVNNTSCSCKIPSISMKFVVFKDYSTNIKINLMNYKTPGIYNYTIPLICVCGNKTYKIQRNVEIKIKKVNTIVINPISISITNKQGKKNITIKNIGNAQTTVTLFTTCPIKLSSYNFNLNPKQEKTVYLYYNFPRQMNINCYILVNNKIKIPVVIVHRINVRPVYHITGRSSNNSTLSKPFMPIFLGFDLLFSKIF